MHNFYIINDMVEFHPVASTLHNLHNPNNTVTLNSPASRCLLLLIKNEDTVVSQQEVMDSVWGEIGMTVSPNTYYQNISVLRKGLKKIGLSEETVITIPRIGLTLAAGTRIMKRDINTPVIHSHDELFGNDLSTHLEAKAPESTTNRAEKTEGVADRMSHTTINSESSKQPTVEKDDFIFWSGTAFLTLLLLMSIISNLNEKDYNYFSDYEQVDSAGNCVFYLPEKTLATNSEKDIKALTYIQYFKSRCQRYPWVYISLYPNMPRVSVIQCDKEIEKSHTCIADYFLEREIN